ncbi:MAG: DUF4960 domain-containing protein [Candidatus Poribacteria bacterium]
MSKSTIAYWILTFLAFSYASVVMIGQATAIPFRLGLVSDGEPKPNAKAAYEWAQKNFDAKIIPPPNAQAELEAYGVVYWDESHAPAIPARYTDKKTVDAFRGYVEAGGGLLLTNLALHYVFEMGVESTQPRYFGRNDNSPLDWTDFAIAKGQENHPIFKGMKIEKGAIQYDIKGWTEGSDFCINNKPKEGKVLAEVMAGHPQCYPLVEYSVGKGTIIVLGWVWSSWVVNKHLEDVHGKLTSNILNYLAEQSAFAPVEYGNKLATVWGIIKKKSD